MPTPIATWNPARGVWETHDRSLWCEHSVPFSEIWPASGSMRSGRAYPLPTRVPRTAATGSSSLLPTPLASDGEKGGPNQRGGSGDLRLSSAVHLMPTPKANDSNGAGAHGDGGPDLPTAVTLLPTPVVTDSNGARNATAGRTDPNSQHHSGTTLTDALWLMAASGEMQRGGVSQSADSDREGPQGPEPTPRPDVPAWGPYRAAIERAERAFGRPAPVPVEPGAKGQPRLAARFGEWLMGLPDGHVTAVPGLSRNDQIKLCGNGVVPAQAQLAVGLLLAQLAEQVLDPDAAA